MPNPRKAYSIAESGAFEEVIDSVGQKSLRFSALSSRSRVSISRLPSPTLAMALESPTRKESL